MNNKDLSDMKILEVLKKMLSCDTTGKSEENVCHSPAEESHKTETKATDDYASPDDIRLAVGDDTLVLVYDLLLGGLHNALAYDPCSGIVKDCFSEIHSILAENLEEAYQSIIVKTGEHEYLLNIGANLLLSIGEWPQEICEDLIDAFYPVIKLFVDNHIVGNKVGVYSIFTNDGTSVGLPGLIHNLEKDGYLCCGVGTTFYKDSSSLERVKGWENFTHIDMNELPENIVKAPNIEQACDMTLSFLHDEVIAEIGK